MEKLHHQPDADSPSLNLLQKTACLKIRKNCICFFTDTDNNLKNNNKFLLPCVDQFYYLKR